MNEINRTVISFKFAINNLKRRFIRGQQNEVQRSLEFFKAEECRMVNLKSGQDGDELVDFITNPNPESFAGWKRISLANQ